MRRRIVGYVAVAALCSTPAGAQQRPDPGSRWNAQVSPGTQIRIRNIRGDISVVPASGRTLEVVSDKVSRRGNPAAVRLEARHVGDAIEICVLWGAMQSCDSPLSRADSRAVGDVAVNLSVKMPAGMRLSVTTVNGDVAVESDTRALTAESTNGNVVVETTSGSVLAMTVNGSVTAYLTEPAKATVDLQSMGKVHSDFALAIVGPMRRGRIQATIGGGGRKVELRALRGDIALRRG